MPVAVSAVGRQLARVTPADVALPLLFAVVGTAEMVVQGYGPLWASIGTIWLACGLLTLRRQLGIMTPLLVAGCYLLAGALGVPIDEPASWILPIAFACFAAGLHAARQPDWAGLVAVLGSLALSMFGIGGFTNYTPDLLFGLAWALAPWGLGQWLGAALARNRQLAAEAARLRLQQEMAVAAAATAERERIARELHDVLAHSLSVMVVQASLAEDVVTKDPEAARRALLEVQQCGRNALGETGRLLRLIRDAGNELGMRPEPALSGLADMADDFGRAGLEVRLHVDPGTKSELPIGLELSVYRVVQEALTNALKHAPGSAVDVWLSRSRDKVTVEVRNGPGSEPAANLSGGHGLVGVRERVSLFGGSLRTEPTTEGGYLLAATFPVESVTS